MRRLTTARSTGGGIVRLHIGTYLIVVSHIDRMFCVLHYPGTMTKGATAMSAMAWVAGGGRCRLPASFPDAADGAGGRETLVASCCDCCGPWIARREAAEIYVRVIWHRARDFRSEFARLDRADGSCLQISRLPCFLRRDRRCPPAARCVRVRRRRARRQRQFSQNMMAPRGGCWPEPRSWLAADHVFGDQS